MKIKYLQSFGLAIILLQLQSHYCADQEELENVVVEQGQQKNLPIHDIIKDQTYTTDQKLNKIRKLLDQQEVDVNAQDTDGKTALNLITFLNGDSKIADFLIQSGADVNQPDNFNETALHNAVKKNAIKVIHLLVSDQADRDLKNDQNVTPVDLASSAQAIKALGFDVHDVSNVHND